MATHRNVAARRNPESSSQNVWEVEEHYLPACCSTPSGDVKMWMGRGRHRKTTARQDRESSTLQLGYIFPPAQYITDSMRLDRKQGVLIVALSCHRPRDGLIYSGVNNVRAGLYVDGVMFSDESRFCLRFTDGCKRVWRRRGEIYRRNTIMEHDSFVGEGVIGWGGVSYDRRSDLVLAPGNLTGQRYVNEILRSVVAPMAHRVGGNFIFQDDNARPNRARLVVDFVGGLCSPWGSFSI